MRKGKYSKHRMINWYWDVRLWIFPYTLVLILVCNLINSRQNVKVIDVIDESTVHIEECTEPIIEETVAIIEDDEITMLTRLADTVAMGRSDEVKRIVMWVAINRSEDRSNGYGLSLKEEINRPNQWQQYDPKAVYLESTYKLASEVYETWETGGARPIYKDMLWFVLNGDGSITVRNQFKAGKNRAEVTFGQE